MTQGSISEMETWKAIPGYSEYEISMSGRVKSLSKFVRKGNGGYRQVPERLIAISRNGDGYKCVTLFGENGKKYMSIHRLIALTFIPNPLNLPVVNHIDGNKENNKPSNLEWATVVENTLHAYNTGLMKPRRPPTKDEIDAIVKRSSQPVRLIDAQEGIQMNFGSIKLCAEYIDVTPACVGNAISRGGLIFGRYKIEKSETNEMLNKKSRAKPSGNNWVKSVKDYCESVNITPLELIEWHKCNGITNNSSKTK